MATELSVIVVHNFFLNKGITVVIDDLVVLERVITSVSTVDGNFVIVKVVVINVVRDLFESLSLLDWRVRVLTIVIIDLVFILLSLLFAPAVLI